MENNNTKKRILLVDDEPGILELYSEVLIDAGFEVDVIDSGEGALEKMAANSYDLVLLDIMMNDGPDGIMVLKRIKANPEKYKKSIIIMLTNLAITNSVKESYDFGAEGYLIKLTLSNDQLVKKVKGYLQGFSNKQNN